MRQVRDRSGRIAYIVEAGGAILGIVHSETSSRARNVKSTGGVKRWIATSTAGEVVSPVNTYTRADAVAFLGGKVPW